MTRTHRYGMSAAAAGALAIAAVGGPAAIADGGGAAQAEPATINMKLTRNGPTFGGAKQVTAGQQLRIVNRTKPRRVGPHTISLTRESVIPNTRKERRNCFTPGKICTAIAVAHKFNPRTEKINQPLVKAGAAGWDTEFTRRRKGDSWYTEKLGEDFSQVVSAEAGTVLHYFCAIHPEMRGEIEVVAAQ